jgi:hypothetical protein
MYEDQKLYTLAGFEPGIFYSVGGRGDHIVPRRHGVNDYLSSF